MHCFRPKQFDLQECTRFSGAGEGEGEGELRGRVARASCDSCERMDVRKVKFSS
jgi:hypothetical protein